MKRPIPLSNQAINALKKDVHNFEAHRRTIDVVNQLVNFVGPGAPVAGQALSVLGVGTGAIYAVTGTYSRGRITITLGTGSGSPTTITLGFPSGTWGDVPFSQVSQNGGTGTSRFSWSESISQLTITIDAPVDGASYVFQYAIRN